MISLHPSQTVILLLCLFAFAISRASGQVRVTYSPPAAATVDHEFVYEPPTAAKSVTVAGTFNGWNKNANPLTPSADRATWRVTLRLPVGEIHYKFVVDDKTWVADPQSAKADLDHDGNSVILLTPSDYVEPASPLDGVTTESALLHPTCEPFLNYDNGRLSLTLRARRNDLQTVTLKQGGRRLPVPRIRRDDLYDYYTVAFDWDGHTNLTYSFELVDGQKSMEFGADGCAPVGKAKKFRLIASEFKAFETPTWPETAVLYQIFPDRFANGDKSNDPPKVQKWGTKPYWYSHFGGDVAGVRQHLPYLSELGISDVYFTPVCKSPSSHRYDVVDYKTVDPQFGTNADFIKLTHEMKERGIGTVMDFVFNHSAAAFAPFADVVVHGEKSAYKDWYFIHSYPVHAADQPNYEAYGGWWGMPKLNEANPATRDYMLGVIDFWQQRVPLSGMRFDVADVVDMSFWRAMRAHVKARHPQAWIVGETWGDASPWLMGDQWDAAMNYPFLGTNVDFFADAKITPSTYTSRLMDLYHSYAPQVSRNMMNSLSTHDTPRFLTRCHNNQDLQKLAATVQFTWPGMPCIYYGEEIGMQGAADPDNRRCMEWQRATPDNAMLQYYKRLIRLRKTSRVLQSGVPAILMTDDKASTFAFSRTLGVDVAIVAVNRSAKTRALSIPLPDGAGRSFVDALSGRRFEKRADGSINIKLGPLQSAVLFPK